MSPHSSPVQPQERAASIDAIRGLAVLGILVMNIAWFATVQGAVHYPTEFGGMSDWDRWSWYLQAMFFNGRMRGLFSMLFGVGLYLQWQKAQRDGYEGQFGDLWTRRCVWLVLFGMIHGYLMQWPGDILFTYGICGLFLFPFRKLKNWSLLLFGFLVLGVATTMGTLGSLEMVEGVAKYKAAAAAKAAGKELDDKQKKAIEQHEKRAAKRSREAMAEEAEKERQKGWWETFLSRGSFTHKMESSLLYDYLFWDCFSFMLLGLALGRWGFFHGHSPTWVYGLMLALGYLVAAPWALYLAKSWADTGYDHLVTDTSVPMRLTFHVERLLGALAHASLLVLLMRFAAVTQALAPLIAVGRTAFSNYVMQTVFGTVIFYGWGLAWFGELVRWQQMVYCLCFWVFAMVVSTLWLKKFRFGPLEWLWRTVVHLRRPG